MAPAIMALIAFLPLTLWRFVFTGMGRGWLFGKFDAPRPRHNGLLDEGLHILDPASLALVAGELENPADGADPFDRKYRARSYLRRIAALTGSTRKGGAYALDVGTIRFEVRDGYVRRMQDVTDPKCAYEETCFYPAHKEMPKAEQIATALLQLRNNPALFDRWAVERKLAFKADGQAFTREQ
jgi:hypothetical protein